MLQAHSLVRRFPFCCPEIFSKVLFECFKLFSDGSEGTKKLRFTFRGGGDIIPVRLLGRCSRTVRKEASPRLPSEFWRNEHLGAAAAQPHSAKSSTRLLLVRHGQGGKHE